MFPPIEPCAAAVHLGVEAPLVVADLLDAGNVVAIRPRRLLLAAGHVIVVVTFMSWLASFGIAILTAILGLFGAGTVSALLVDWYHISSFEGGSGYFVIGNSLLGGIAGFVVGLIVARVVAGWPQGGVLKALGVSFGAVL